MEGSLIYGRLQQIKSNVGSGSVWFQFVFGCTVLPPTWFQFLWSMRNVRTKGKDNKKGEIFFRP